MTSPKDTAELKRQLRDVDSGSVSNEWSQILRLEAADAIQRLEAEKAELEINVPWITIKKIMAAIQTLASEPSPDIGTSPEQEKTDAG